MIIVIIGVGICPNIAKRITAKKQHEKFKGVLIDLFTASLITKIYDKVNYLNYDEPNNILTFENALSTISTSPIRKTSVFTIRDDYFILSDTLSSSNYVYKQSLDKAKLSGSFMEIPKREDVTEPINEQLVVELYSK